MVDQWSRTSAVEPVEAWTRGAMGQPTEAEADKAIVLSWQFTINTIT